MKSLSFFIAWLACCQFAFGIAGSWNGVAATAWNGIASTAWNGTGVNQSAGGGGGMTFTGLASRNSVSNATSYVTAAAYLPTGNALVLCTVVNTTTSPTAPTTPTFSGNSLTWVQIDTDTITDGTDIRRCTLFRAMGASPTSTTGTADFAGNTQTSCSFRVVQIAGTDTTGTNGSGAIVQSAKATGTSTTPSVTLAALASGTSSVYAGFVDAKDPFGATPEASWTEDEDSGNGSPNTGILSYYRLATTDNTVAVTTASTVWVAIAVEIKP